MITTKWFEDVSSRSQPNPHCDDVSQRHIHHLESSWIIFPKSQEFHGIPLKKCCFWLFFSRWWHPRPAGFQWQRGGHRHLLQRPHQQGLENTATRRHGHGVTRSQKIMGFFGAKERIVGKISERYSDTIAVDCRLTYIHMYIYTVCVCVYWCVLVIMIRIIVQGLGPPCLTNQYISFVHGKHLPEMDGNSTWLGCKEPTRIAVIYCDIKHVGRP